jgi:hypothetical protein
MVASVMREQTCRRQSKGASQAAGALAAGEMKRILEVAVRLSVGKARETAAIEADVARGILKGVRRFPLDVHASTGETDNPGQWVVLRTGQRLKEADERVPKRMAMRPRLIRERYHDVLPLVDAPSIGDNGVGRSGEYGCCQEH